MSHNILYLDPANPGTALQRCRDIVRHGGVIAYPTDTFYGLGADPKSAEAVRRLFAIKGRSDDQPILLLLAEAGEIEHWAAKITPQAALLIKRFWPGPLTIIFRAKPEVLPELTAGFGTIGLRVPANELTRDLVRMLGGALTATSANRSGMPSPRNAVETAAAVGDGIDGILDGGETAGGHPSTIVDCSGNDLRIIREGAVPASVILQVIAEDARRNSRERIVA